MITQETNQINILSYLRIFFRRKWFFITPLLLGLGAGFFSANTLPKIYESYTLILVEEEKLDNPVISGLAVSTSAAQRLRNLREQILGWNRLVKLAEKLTLTHDIKNQRQFENLILNDLRKNINVAMYGPSLVRIAFRGENPGNTQLTVKTITDIFIEENITSQNKESDVAISFLEEQLKIYKNKIKASEIAGMEDQLKNLLVDSTEEHPLVKDLRAKIAKARAELPLDKEIIIENPEFVKNPMYEKLRQDFEKEISSIKISQVTGEISTTASQPSDDNFYKVMLLSAVMARDLGVNQTIYNMLLQRLETAKISKRLEESKQGTRYTIIDPPRLPFAPVKPNKVIVTLIGAFVGGILGFGLIVLMELIDMSFLGIEDAKAALDLPILGAIAKIMTQEDVAREHARRTMRLGISITASIAFVFIVIIYSIIAKP
jgi:uncharacterized protein involved in exopolysaccharide biosynthesis